MSRLETKNNNSLVGPSFWLAPSQRQVLSGIIGRERTEISSFGESLVPDLIEEESRDLILLSSQVGVSSCVANKKQRLQEKNIVSVQVRCSLVKHCNSLCIGKSQRRSRPEKVL